MIKNLSSAFDLHGVQVMEKWVIRFAVACCIGLAVILANAKDDSVLDKGSPNLAAADISTYGINNGISDSELTESD